MKIIIEVGGIGSTIKKMIISEFCSSVERHKEKCMGRQYRRRFHKSNEIYDSYQ